MRRSTLAILWLSLVAGCSNERTPLGAAGTTAGGTAELDAGKDSGTDSGVEVCDVEARLLLEANKGSYSNLSVVGDKLVYVARAEITTIGSIEVLGTDGRGLERIYSVSEGRNIRDARAHGDVVYFVEENRRSEPTYELFSVPLAGGAATLIADLGVKSGFIFGIDDAHVYVTHETHVERVAIASGAIERIGSLASALGVTDLQLSGNDIFFMAQTDNGLRAIYHLDKSASDADATLLEELDVDDPCHHYSSVLLATPTKLVCGYGSLATRSRDGALEEIVHAGTSFPDGDQLLVADGETFYFREEPSWPLRRLTTSGAGRASFVACDASQLAVVWRGLFAVDNAFEIVVGENEIFWIEQKLPEGDSSSYTFKIRSAPK